MTTVATVTAGAGADTVVNQNFDAVSAAAMYGRRAPATAGLTWAFYGGRGFGNTIADGTVSLTASTTNYVVANRSSGAVSVATNTTNWNDTTNYFRVRLIVTGTASITTETDYREFGGGAAGGGGGMTNPMTTAGDIIIGGTSGAPARLAASTNGYVLTLASGVPVWAASAGGGFSNPMTTAGDLIVGGLAGAAGRLGVGTNGYVLTVTAGAVGWAAPSGGGGGLTGFTSSIATASPNNSVNVAHLSADVTTSSGGLAISPKSNGALMMQIPDSTATGGNVRGAFAIDLQRQRGAANQVASGQSSVAIGASNRASGQSSTAIGDSHVVTSSSYGSALGGYQNTVGGYAATAVGGRVNTVNGNQAISLGGQLLNDRGVAGLAVFGCAAQTSNSLGKRQGELYAWAAATANATPTALTTDGGTAGAANQAVLANNSVICISGQVTARQSTGDVKCWTFSAAVKRGANAAATALVGTPTVTVVGADAGASAWAVDIIADTTNGALVVRATGEASKSIVWTASGMSAYAEA